MAPAVADAGFTAIVNGPASHPTPPWIDRPGESSAAREARILRAGFAGWMARFRCVDVLEVCAHWHPELLVCEELDFGAMVAAERVGLPYASVLVIAAGTFTRHDLIADPLNALRAEHGLLPDPTLSMLSRYLVLSPCPPAYRDPACPLPATGHAIRPAALDRSPGLAAPDRNPFQIPSRPPIVYCTLGTVDNLTCGDLFERMIAGLRELPIELIVTVGHQRDPAGLGPQPANIRVERYIPQALVLPRCSLVVSHAGSGTVIGALAHGVPMVLLPRAADQPHNARRCEDLGVGLSLDPLTASAEAIREAATRVLAQPSFRLAAERLRNESAALPGPDHAIDLLQRLQQVRQPILADSTEIVLFREERPMAH